MIYFITTIGFYSDKYKDLAGKRHSRPLGYFFSFEEAKETILGNLGDIFEAGFYSYAVIEKIPEGLYQEPVLSCWYRLEGSNVQASLIDPPSFAKDCSWSLGL